MSQHPPRVRAIVRSFFLARSVSARRALLAALASSLLAAACEADEAVEKNDERTERDDAGSTSSGGPGAPNDAAAPPPDASADAALAPRDGGVDSQTVPTEPDALFAYLQRGEYRGFTAESAVHQSTGPHGGRVRTYVNDTLFQTLSSGIDHAVGAASVKELYGGGDTLTGWAVEVKIDADSAGGDGWYWYEVFSTQNGSSPIEGVGNSTCTGCHAAGLDYFRSPFPLQ